jgi:KaiC/GvpD/RAD55 family RecA-like ATPase
MSYKRMDAVRVRGIEMLKMRGTNHSQRIHPYEITTNGIVIHPNEQIYQV